MPREHSLLLPHKHEVFTVKTHHGDRFPPQLLTSNDVHTRVNYTFQFPLGASGEGAMTSPIAETAAKAKTPHAGRSSKRRAILEGALLVFLGEGYASANMDRIAEVAGVSKKTIYNHFGSKDDLFMEIVSSMVDEILEPLAGPAANYPTVHEALLDFAQRYAEVILSERRLMLHRLVMGEITRFPNLGLYYNTGYARATDGVARMLERLARRGHLQILDFSHAATCFWQLTIAESHNELLFAPTLERSDLNLTARLKRGINEFLMIYGSMPGDADE